MTRYAVPSDVGGESGSVLLAVVGLMAALVLMVLCASEDVLDGLRLVQDRQRVVQEQVALENEWQCLWWHWQQSTLSFPQPVAACGASALSVGGLKSVAWVEPSPPCLAAEGERCTGAWITLRHAHADDCRLLQQFVLRRERFEHDRVIDAKLWRGQRRWQSCSLASS
ncbi:hypothetical protein [Zymobacter palmae]|uniref:hypothetical protein n=1 Tax=Zymobacter palmae TaxID=33074 RepID=UPI0004848B88|nr:hypothetical protein [Zymobacter palmae]